MMVEVVVPWQGGCEHRTRALRWVLEKLRGFDVTLAELDGPPWVKARAVGPAVEASTADVIVVHDADVLCDDLPAAIAAVEAGVAWARPHKMLHRLTEAATDQLFETGAVDLRDLTQPPYSGVRGGGIVVASRQVLLDVPLDPRFVGWGGEDQSWGLALTRLFDSRWFGKAPLIHLWHPPQPRRTRKRGSAENHALYMRYCRAARQIHDRGPMRELIEEARVAYDADKPALPDRQQVA